MKINTKYFPHYARYKKKIDSVPLEGKPKRIILISDSHISNSPIFNLEIYNKGIEEINKIKKVDYIIHLGDLTHGGTYLDYQYALELLKPINKDIFFCIPGNHDAKNVGYLLFEEFFDSRTFKIDEKDLLIIGIDSSIPDQDSGKIGRRAIEKTREQFLNNSDKTRIFCFHHHLLPIPLTGRERSAVIDSGDALKMILETNIDLILNGHRHISNVYSCSDGEEELVMFNGGTFSCNKTRYKELFTYTILDIFEKAVLFRTKKLINGERIKRGRYINRVFYPTPPKFDKKLNFRIAHIGNTHFSSGNFREDMYKKAVKQINTLNADLVVHTGDVTNANQYVEYKKAVAELDKIMAHKIIIPGDNDLKTIGWDLFPEFIGTLEPFYENDKIRIAGINSIDPAIESGIIGRKRMNEVIKIFKEKPKNKINIVALYHNLIPHPKTKFNYMLSDAGNVIKFFTEPENNIHFILTGHNHISFSIQLEDTVFSTCGTLSSRDYLDMDLNTYNVIDCYEDGLVEVNKVLVKTNSSQLMGQYWINLN